MITPRFSFPAFTLTAVGALLCASAAIAATPSSSSSAQARFRQDMAVCNSGQSNQDAVTCREEARRALAAARRGGLDDAPGQYQQNALQRCGSLKGDDRTDCEARMRGEGNVQGSVGGGGILRETVTTTATPAK
jgi:hypothetical protein